AARRRHARYSLRFALIVAGALLPSSPLMAPWPLSPRLSRCWGRPGRGPTGRHRMADRVRSHTRRKPGGGSTTVRQHSRKSRPRKGLVSPGHAWQTLKKAYRAGRKKKRVLAAVLVIGGTTEMTAWLTLRGLSLILVTAGVLAVGAGTAAGR